MSFGVPYKGSKNVIARFIIENLPSANTFVDLFAGGAVTHVAMQSGKYYSYIMNDINPMPTQLFMDAMLGKYANETRWISREDFFALKDTDPYVKYCWSFGNDGESYLYGREIEPYKRALHYAIVLNDPTELHKLGIDANPQGETSKERMAWFRKYMDRKIECESHERLQRLKRLQEDVYLQRLQDIESLQRLQKDYREVELPIDSVVYCDVPYRNTRAEYCKRFDHESFWEWVRLKSAQGFKIFVSEYEAPDDFEIVAERIRIDHFSATDNTKKVTERIYTYRAAKELKGENHET